MLSEHPIWYHDCLGTEATFSFKMKLATAFLLVMLLNEPTKVHGKGIVEIHGKGFCFHGTQETCDGMCQTLHQCDETCVVKNINFYFVMKKQLFLAVFWTNFDDFFPSYFFVADRFFNVAFAKNQHNLPRQVTLTIPATLYTKEILHHFQCFAFFFTIYTAFSGH